MKLQKVLLSVVLGSLFAAGTAMAEDPVQPPEVKSSLGTVHFKGFINNVPCSIDSKFLDQTVDFGEISRNELTTGTYRTDSKTFNIELKNCDTTTYKTAQIQFTAPTIELKDGTATSKYVGLGSIQNAGIALTDSGGKAIELGSRFPAEKYTLNGGRDQITPLNFAAYVKGNQSAVAGEQATTGHFDTPVNFQIFYQ